MFLIKRIFKNSIRKGELKEKDEHIYEKQGVNQISTAKFENRVVRNVLINSSVLTLGLLLGRITGFIFSPIIARTLGSADLGAYQLSNVIINYFSSIVLFGLNPLVVRKMSNEPQNVPRIFGAILGFRSLLIIAAWMALYVMITSMNYPLSVTQMTLLLSVGLIVTGFSDVADCVFQAHEKMVYSVIAMITGMLVYLVLGILALLYNFGILGLAAANAIGMISKLAVSLLLVKLKFFDFKFQMNWREHKAVFQEAIPFFLGSVSASVLSKVDVFILSRFESLSVVGIYVAGYFFLDISLFIPSSFSQAIYPVLSRAATNANDLQDLTHKFYKLIFAVSLLISIIVMILSKWLIIFFYGEKFGASNIVTQIVIWSIMIVAYNNTVGRSIYAAGGQWPLVIVNVLGALSNIILNLYLIPHYNIIGSSIATVISFLITAIMHFYFSKKYHCSVNLSFLLRVIPILVLSLIINYYLSLWSWVASLIVTPIVYIASLFLFGYFDDSERKAIRSLLNTKE
jgi:O-antigen/teichoic acid export membrane protein